MTESLECRVGLEDGRNQSRSLSLKNKTLSLKTAGDWLVRVTDALLAWQYRAHERSHLMTLDDRMLRDIGLARADVENEAGKPFWRP
ncbi:MAG TPA: DUF1127 domain-containing protein [Hypericibacter adhaerens]|nr:DUF1127 domain-containing protein [Hypericibacter adhaerens]HWA42904.1 DUF1127 domain-containing protein [Hypericibacter adhaerens]